MNSLLLFRGLSPQNTALLKGDFLQRWKIRLDPENKKKIILDGKALKLKLGSKLGSNLY